MAGDLKCASRLLSPFQEPTAHMVKAHSFEHLRWSAALARELIVPAKGVGVNDAGVCREMGPPVLATWTRE